MITRIARNDVVRVVRTGEVGTVKGWADHENLDTRGTVIDVQVSRDRTVQASSFDLEFVASAKRQYRGGRLAAWWVLLIATAALAAWLAWDVNNRNHTGVIVTAMFGTFTWQLWFVMLRTWLLDPHKTRVRSPRRQLSTAPRR